MDPPPEPAWAWLLAGLCASLAWHEARAPEPPPLPPDALRRWELDADPARMSPRELRRLPGLGERRAVAAAQARFEHDPAQGPLPWTAVPGIGETTAGKVAAWLEQHGFPDAPLADEESSAAEPAARDP